MWPIFESENIKNTLNIHSLTSNKSYFNNFSFQKVVQKYIYSLFI